MKYSTLKYKLSKNKKITSSLRNKKERLELEIIFCRSEIFSWLSFCSNERP